MQSNAAAKLPFHEHRVSTRNHARLVVDASVRVFPNSKVQTMGRAQDISRGGMSLYVPLDLANGDVIRVMFNLPYSSMRFGITAVVKNRTGFRYGVEFMELTNGEALELDRVISILGLTSESRPFLVPRD